MESDEFQAHITLVMSTLDKAVQNLDDLTELLPSLERLGTIHANMGIKKEQFAVSCWLTSKNCTVFSTKALTIFAFQKRLVIKYCPN